VLFDDQGFAVPADPNFDLKWGVRPTFAGKSWNRYTEAESPDFESLNANWDSRETMWYMPLDWVNYVDQIMFTDNYPLMKRYTTMLYMAVLMLGANEIGPVNEFEMVFLIGALISAALLNALLFGNVASLIFVLSKQ